MALRARSQAREAPIAPRKPLVVGSKVCAECHDRPEPRTDPKFPPLCQCTEYGFWIKHDKHHDAYKALTGELGRQMGRLLKKDVSTSPECLACHSTVASDSDIDRSFSREEGVTCVLCHGAYENWIYAHGQRIEREAERWRSLDPQVKDSVYGMKDLWNPATRAEICNSCHIGNSDEGKFVTHAMYAAGHPPLPSFDVAAFSTQMPPHWQSLRDKPAAVQAALHVDPAHGRSENTELVIIGSVAALRDTVRLVAGQASQAARPGSEASLDFAVFDCYACHHELTTNSWRQRRGYHGAPGRPPMRDWPIALGQLGVLELSKSDSAVSDTKGQLGDLQRAFAARPFGDPAEVTKAAAPLANKLEELLKRSRPAPYTAAKARELLLAVCSVGIDGALPDYDTARQIGWALETISNEWKDALDSAEARSILERLRRDLKLDLPAGTARQLVGELPLTLAQRNAYNPDTFRDALRALAKALRSRP
jgi:hypothetical protein